MGRSTTPQFRIDYIVNRGTWTAGTWNSRQAGRPTAANLAKYVALSEASTKPGGCNAHIGETVVLSAKITNQFTGEVRATYEKTPDNRFERV